MRILLMTLLFTLLMTSQARAEEPVAGISITLDKVKDMDIYSGDELSVLYKIVEAEATGETIESKKNVASVIINRVHSKIFPDTIKDVVFQDKQFSPVADGRFWSVEVTDETIQAVNNVIKCGITTEALYFCNKEKISKKKKRWFEELEFLFKDEANHSFFK